LADSSPSETFIVAVDPAAPPPRLDGAVAAIGNFDGVHRGHVAVIERAKALARKLGRPCIVLTFEPHPTDFFKGPNTIFRLTPCATKAKILERRGIDGMIVLTFDRALASLPAEAFVVEVLLRHLGIRAVVAGYDFHFGADRSGTPAFLRQAGERLGFVVEIVERIPAGTGDQAASSTATRAALEGGDVVLAARLLGHPFAIMGTVIQGQKLGRTLGFPTANLLPDPSCRLRHGVYAVRVGVGTKTYDGVASYGRRPTFDNGPALLEAFLFDFSSDLYGETIEVLFAGWIRAEAKFDSAEVLVQQMKRDEAWAKEILRAQPSG
jgi:riboflavin kinase / FMN adenylyltransferase